MTSRTVTCWTFIGVLFLAATVPAAAQIRSETHEKYAASLWKFLHPTTGPKYVRWTVASSDLDLQAGPPLGPGTKTYLNPLAAAAADKLPHGSVVVTEHIAPGGDKPTAVTIRYRFQPGYQPSNDDWYWANYLPDGRLVRTMADKAPYDKRGFAAYLQDGRLWLFRLGSETLAEYLTGGELAKHVTHPGVGPGGVTVKASDADTVSAYLAAADGFETKMQEGRIWVFRPGSVELAEFEKSGELAKHIIRPGAGPQGMTVKAADAETLDAYLRSAVGRPTSDG